MAEEEKTKKKQATDACHIPPPFDPFPTYQTPFPRSHSSSEEGNPFIQFRRFADQQFSSLFHSLGFDFPGLFNHSSWPSHNHWEEMCKRRRQVEEGWRKQWEQQVEEIRAENDLIRQEMLKDLRAAGVVGAEKCPALQSPPTELDIYEAQQPTKRQSKSCAMRSKCDRYRRGTADAPETPASKPAPKTDRDAINWFGLGYDGRQRAKAQKGTDETAQDLMSKAVARSAASTHHLDPIDNPDHTLPWLLMNHYSPLYLCNPGQDRLLAAFFTSVPAGPLNVFSPFYSRSDPTEVDQRLARALPWADAFEDLMSIHHTGQMVERNYSTWRTPDDWIAGMIGRGVLKGWELDEEGRMIRKDEIDPKYAGERKSRWNRRQYRNDGEENERILRIAEVGEDEDQPSANAVTDALRKAQETQTGPQADSGSKQAEEEFNAAHDFFSSSAASSWPSWASSSNQDTNSIIQTMTTVERRTLPDGKIETKRVLKKKFADGREESRESIEHENGSKLPSSFPKSDRLESPFSGPIAWPEQPVDKFTEPVRVQNKKTQTPASQPQDDNKRRGGWFWN